MIKSRLKKAYKKIRNIFKKNGIYFYNRICAFIYKNRMFIIKFFIPLAIICSGFYACSMIRSSVKYAINDIFDISAEIRTAYATQSSYWGVSSDSLIKNKMISNKYIAKKGIILSTKDCILVGHGANGDVVLPGMTTFDIALPHLTKAQCMAFSEYPLSQNKLFQIEKITIHSATNEYAFSWGGENTLPVKEYSSKDFCTDRDNTVVWTFK